MEYYKSFHEAEALAWFMPQAYKTSATRISLGVARNLRTRQAFEQAI